MHGREVAVRGSTGKSEVFVILVVFAGFGIDQDLKCVGMQCRCVEPGGVVEEDGRRGALRFRWKWLKRYACCEKLLNGSSLANGGCPLQYNLRF